MSHTISRLTRVILNVTVNAGVFLGVTEVTASQEPPAPLPITPAVENRQSIILVSGATGADEYQTVFATWAARWQDAAERSQSDWHLIGQSPVSPAPAPAAEDEPKPEGETVANAEPPLEGQPATEGQAAATIAHDDRTLLMEALAAEKNVVSKEPLWLVFIGHGTFDGRTASWNLRGPDVSSEELAKWCEGLQRPLAVVVCASCSAPFVNSLSGPDRVIVSATKDGNQIQYSRFGEAMSIAISTLEADINRDGQTSLLEAWLFASRRTADFYKTEGRLATEHSLLDDNGDALGVRSELYEGDQIVASAEEPDKVDGRLAARWSLVRSDDEKRLSPEQRQTRDELEQQIEQLRQRRSELDETEYLRQLETLLIPLARIYEDAEKKNFE